MAHVETTTATTTKHHGLFCRLKTKLSHLCGQSGHSHPTARAEVVATSNKEVAQPKISIHLRGTSFSDNTIEALKPTLSEQLDQTERAARAYAQPSAGVVVDQATSLASASVEQAYVHPKAEATRAMSNPSASQYLAWAADWTKAADIRTGEERVAAINNAANSAIRGAVLGAKDGIKTVIDTFSSHPPHSKQGISREANDSRINSLGVNDISFWEKVRDQLQGKTSNPSTPVLTRYSSPSIKPQNYEIAAQFIRDSRSVVNDLESLPESFVTEWVQHFNTAVEKRVLPNFDILRQQYQDAVHPRSPQKVDVKI